MNIESFREYCLSLGEVEEKLPFAKMPGGDSVLVFYVNGHTFCYCDINDFKTVIVKCQPERIPELMENTNVENQPALTYTFQPTANDYNVVEVRAVYEGEKTSVKAVKGLFVPLSVGEQVTQTVSLYPNPSDESVFVASEADLQAIKLYDIAGRLVRHITICGTTTELDVKDLDGGIYFIQAIYSDGNTTTQKLVVTH